MRIIINGKRYTPPFPRAKQVEDCSLVVEAQRRNGGIDPGHLCELIQASRFSSITGIEVRE